MKKRNSTSPQPFIYGKVPPQARELEEAILGACMLEREAFSKTVDRITANSFYVDAHQLIYKAMQTLASKSQPIDILTVEEELRKSEELEQIGGLYFVTKLTNSVVSSANIETHCDIIQRRYIRRELIKIGSKLVEDGYDNSGDENTLMEEALQELTSLSDTSDSSGLKNIDTILVNEVKELEAMRHREETLTGVPAGYLELDKITNGWQNTDLIILAARPSKGKTAFALNLGRNAAANMRDRKRKGVGIFSLEMNDRQLVQRLLAREAKVFLSVIKNARMNDEAMENLFNHGIRPLSGSQIYIDDRAGLTLWQVKAQAKRMVEKFNCGLIIVDYLQLMSGMDEKNTKNREQEISTISRGLKGIAKELQVPVIALSQLSRQIENRHGANSEPQLSDLRESGAIEQDADMVMFLYGPRTAEVMEDASLADKVLLKIAKNRQGPLEILEYRFDKPHQAFTEVGAYKEETVTGAAVTQNKWAGFPGVSGRLKPIQKDEENYFV